MNKTQQKIYIQAKEKWDAIAKPIDSLGVFEDMVARLYAIAGTVNPGDYKRRALLTLCADHGVVAEGVTDAGKLADLIQKETGIESRVSVLGYIQRGGQPTAKDRMYGSLMGAYAIEILRQGRGNRIVAIKNDILVDYDIAEAIDLHNNNLDSFQYQLSLMLAE